MDIRNTDSDSISILPSFGSSAEFSSISQKITYANNLTFRGSIGINNLSMKLNLSFNELTDDQSNNLISFLQSKFYYEQQTYSSDGSFSNKRITPFSYLPFYPYRLNNFICLSFKHDKIHYNVNNIRAEFTSIGCTTLDSVEPGAGLNNQISSNYEATQVSLGVNNGVRTINIDNTSDNNTVISVFDGKTVFFTNGNYTIFPVISRVGSNPSSSPYSISSNSNINLNVADPLVLFLNYNDGHLQNNNLRHSIYIDTPSDCSFYPYKPITSDGEIDFRMFDFRPSQSMSLSSSPKYKSSSADDFYVKFNKYGFNPNLSNISLSFTGRSNLEAKRILLFLESHLGYKKFGFHFQKDYSNAPSDDQNTSPHRSRLAYFYCPEWSHTFVYNNNHTISATFIECLL